jgi:hypothetical protein
MIRQQGDQGALAEDADCLPPYPALLKSGSATTEWLRSPFFVSNKAARRLNYSSHDSETCNCTKQSTKQGGVASMWPCFVSSWELINGAIEHPIWGGTLFTLGVRSKLYTPTNLAYHTDSSSPKPTALTMQPVHHASNGSQGISS